MQVNRNARHGDRQGFFDRGGEMEMVVVEGFASRS